MGYETSKSGVCQPSAEWPNEPSNLNILSTICQLAPQATIQLANVQEALDLGHPSVPSLFNFL
jgi:hypothetical protein